jgi:hypothetical protein
VPVNRREARRVEQYMTTRSRLPAIALAAVAAAGLAACGSGGPSYPHSWCAPLVTQFHAKLEQAAYAAGLTALQGQGAPVGQFAADLAAYEHDKAEAATTNDDSFTALAGEPKAIAKVEADIKQLNATCGQPGDAWKSDSI